MSGWPPQLAVECRWDLTHVKDAVAARRSIVDKLQVVRLLEKKMIFSLFGKKPKDTRSTKEILDSLGPEISDMTVHEIERKTGVLFHHVMLYASLKHIKLKDYDGTLSPEERKEESSRRQQFGELNAQLICPHCQTKGTVRRMSAEETSSTKVIPVVGNNIKTKKRVTQMHCDNCGTTWNV